MMKALLYKEWCAQRKVIYIWGGFIILLCGVLNGMLGEREYSYIGSQIVYGFSLVFCSIQVFLYSMNMEGKNKIYVILKSVPSSSREVVLSKYIFSVLCFFIYLIVSLVTVLGLKLLFINASFISFNTLSISLAIFLLLISLYIPIFFKVIGKNMGYINSVFMILMVLVYNLVFKNLKKDYINTNIIGSLNDNITVFSSLILVISLILLYISHKISIGFYKNREEL